MQQIRSPSNTHKGSTLRDQLKNSTLFELLSTIEYPKSEVNGRKRRVFIVRSKTKNKTSKSTVKIKDKLNPQDSQQDQSLPIKKKIQRANNQSSTLPGKDKVKETPNLMVNDYIYKYVQSKKLPEGLISKYPYLQVNHHDLYEEMHSSDFLDLNPRKIIKFFKEAKITLQMPSKVIYSLIFNFLSENGIRFAMPTIKKYKNCVYFGASIVTGQAFYKGILFFQGQQKVYYGSLKGQRKYGKGVQIDLKSQKIYKGNFQNGRKQGKFIVQSNEQRYEGELKNGKYDGIGKLSNCISIYLGQFKEGVKNGIGQQTFLHSNTVHKGMFKNGLFSNLRKSQIELKKGVHKRNNSELSKTHIQFKQQYPLITQKILRMDQNKAKLGDDQLQYYDSESQIELLGENLKGSSKNSVLKPQSCIKVNQLFKFFQEN